MRFLVASIVVWFYVFSGVYRISGLLIYPALLIGFLGLFFYTRSLFIEIKPLFVFAIVFLGLTLMSQFSSGFDGNMFSYFIRYFVKSLIIPLCGVFFIFRLLRGFEYPTCAKILVLVLFMQFFLTVLQMGFTPFRVLFFAHVQLADNWKALSDVGHFRATGLAGLSIYDTSVSYSFLLLAICGLQRRNLWLLGVGVLLALVLSLIAGRTGFLLSLILVACLFLNSKRKLFLVLLGGGIVFIALFMASEIIGFDELYLFSRFVFEPIYSFVETGRFSSASTSHLVEDYLFIPWHAHPIWGQGYWAQPSLSRLFGLEYQTDSGFLLCFIAFGVLGVILCAAYLLWLYHVIFQVVRDCFGLKVGTLLCYAILCVILFFLMLKAPFFLSERVVPALLIVIVMRFVGGNARRDLIAETY